MAQELRTKPDVISLESFKEFISEIPGIHRALLDARTKAVDDLHATHRMLVTQFIHAAFGTRGSDTIGKCTAHEVDNLEDARQLVDVLGVKVQDVDPEFVMQSLENIMPGSFMVWLQDASKGTTSAGGAQLIQRTLHLPPHSHYPLCLQGLSAKHIITTANAIWAHQRALPLQGAYSLRKQRAQGHTNTSTSLITGLGIRFSKGKNASRAISHNLTIGYIIGYDKYRSLPPQIRRGPLGIIRDCTSSGGSYGYVVLA